MLCDKQSKVQLLINVKLINHVFLDFFCPVPRDTKFNQSNNFYPRLRIIVLILIKCYFLRKYFFIYKTN